MELVYLWVEDYKNIHKQGFNFSPRFRCEFKDEYEKYIDTDGEEKERLKDNCELEIIKNDYLKEFFGKDINITAIIGENGVGKSNILELLYRGTSSNQKYFYIIDVGDELLIRGLQINNNNEPFLTSYTINKDVFNKDKKISVKCEIKNNTIHEQKNISFIYFSNVSNLIDGVDLKCIVGNSDTHKFNISTNYLINYYSKHQTEMRKDEYKDRFISFENQYNLYQIKNIQKTILMLKKTDLELPIKIPKKIFITLKENVKNNEKFNMKACSLYEKVLREMIYLFFEYKFIDFEQIDTEKIYSKCIEELEDKVREDKVTDYNNLFEELNKCFEKKIRDSMAYYQEDFILMQKFLNILKSYEIDKYNQIVINIENIDEEFIDIYKELTFGALDFLYFDWYPDLSTGEENLLFQFSNFYDVYLNPAKKLNTHIFCFIDEGETTLNPHWQQKYVKYLTEFFKKNFLDKTIHIILSSHSPFILSDLPKQNVIFLEKDEETGNCINASDKVDINPFGANIHTLLSHGFFMKDGLMGEFAKDKIDIAIKYLNQKVLTKDELDYCENIISIIGEPIIKRQLQKMIDSKRLSEIDVIKKQIAELQLELANKENKK